MACVERRTSSTSNLSQVGVPSKRKTLIEEITQTTFVKHADGNVLVCVHEDYGETDGQQISFLGTPGKIRSHHIAAFDYEAKMQDELDLQQGDAIIVTEVHGDGWASGKNLRTMKHGIFPMNFVQDQPSQPRQT